MIGIKSHHIRLITLLAVTWSISISCKSGIAPIEGFPHFDLSIFFNKIFDTLLQIIVIAFGFILLDIWWKRKEERKKALPFEEYLLSQVDYICQICQEIIQKIEIVHSEDSHEWINERDDVIKREIERLEVITSTVVSLLGENSNLDIRTTRAFTYFLANIDPTIRRLSECSKREIQGQLDIVKDLFSTLKQDTRKTRKFLKEESHDID